MSNGLQVVLGAEWRAMRGSGVGMHAVLAVLVLLWSVLLAGTGGEGMPESAVLWLLPFSVIVVSNTGQGVFVSERMSGAVEILLTSGLGRFEIMGGKMVFVGVLGTAIGYICMLLGMGWIALFERLGMGDGVYPSPVDFIVFACSVAVNTGLLALLSVLLPNPRLSHFISFLFTAAVLALYYPFAVAGQATPWFLAAALAVCALAAIAAALRLSHSEAIARRVML